MVTNIEAVRAAVKAGEIANEMVAADGTTKDEADAFLFTAMLRAYLDALGLVMVPKKPTSKMTRVAGDNLFAGMDRLLERAIAAAPDPFGETS